MIGARMMMGAAGRRRPSPADAGAVYFNGTGENYYTTGGSMPAILDDTVITVGAWARIDAVTADSRHNAIFGSARGSYGSFSARVAGPDVYYLDARLWEFGALRGDNGRVRAGWGSPGADGRWRLIVFTVEDGTVYTYSDVDRAGMAESDRAAINSDLLVAESLWHIGRSGLNRLPDQITGAVCDVWRIDATLSTEQLNVLAAGAPISDVAEPINWWKLAGADDTRDYGAAGNDLIVTGTPESDPGPPAA